MCYRGIRVSMTFQCSPVMTVYMFDIIQIMTSKTWAGMYGCMHVTIIICFPLLHLYILCLRLNLNFRYNFFFYGIRISPGIFSFDMTEGLGCD